MELGFITNIFKVIGRNVCSSELMSADTNQSFITLCRRIGYRWGRGILRRLCVEKIRQSSGYLTGDRFSWTPIPGLQGHRDDQLLNVAELDQGRARRSGCHSGVPNSSNRPDALRRWIRWRASSRIQKRVMRVPQSIERLSMDMATTLDRWKKVGLAARHFC